MSQNPPLARFGDATQGLITPAFATFPIPVTGSSPFPTSGQGYRIPANRTQAVNVVNNSAATVWISPGGGGAQGNGVPVRPFTSKTFLTNTDYVGVFVGTPLLGTLSTATQSISLTLSSVALPPSEVPVQRPVQPGVAQWQASGANSAQTITIAGVAGTVISCVALTLDYTAGGTGVPALTIKDGTTQIYNCTVANGTSFSPNLGPGLVGTPGNAMVFTVGAGGGGGATDLSIITTQGPI